MAFPEGWSGYAEATITNPSSSLTDFPYIISLNQMPSAWWAAVGASGGDIRVTDGNNTQLPADLIHFSDSGSSGSGLLVCKLSPSSSGWQRIRIWAGKAGETFPADNNAYGADNAYPSHCKAFYPDGGGNDRTVNANNLSMSGSPTVGGGAGPIDGSKGTDYNGSTQYGTATASVPTVHPWTLIGWAKSDSITTNQYAIAIADTGSADQDVIGCQLAGGVASDPVRAVIVAGGTASTASSSTGFTTAYHQVSALYTSTTSRHGGIDGAFGSPSTASRTPSGLDTISVGALVSSSASQFFDGHLSLVEIHNTALSAAWVAYRKEMLDDANQSDFYGVWMWGEYSPPTLPNFVKQGSVLATPGWLSGTGNELMFPRLFDNDAHRATLAGLPAERWSMLFSSDHAVGTGYIGRADSDNLAGPWTDSGAAIHSAGNQRETPHPVFDPLNDRVNVYVHQATSSVTNGTQASRLMTTTDLETLTDQGECFPYGNHTGYAQVYWDAGSSLFHANHVMSAGTSPFIGHSTSADGDTFTFTGLYHINQQHVCGVGKCLQGGPLTFQHGGRWYSVALLSTVPRTGTGAATHIVATPIVSQSDLRPNGPCEILLAASPTTSDPDYRLLNYFDVVSDGGSLYLFYSGSDNSGNQHINLAVSSNGTASTITPLMAPDLDGTVGVSGSDTDIFSWDAANDAFPTADLTMTAATGSNASNQSVGNYYEMKTGSGSAQDLQLTGDVTFDPRDHETVEFEIEGLTFDNGDAEDLTGIQIGFGDSVGAIERGIAINFTGDLNDKWGHLSLYNGDASPAFEADLYTVPYSDTDTTVSEWLCSQQVKLTIRLCDYGDKLIVLVNDAVVAARDLSNDGLTWAAGIFPFFRLLNADPYPEFFARFTGVSARTFGAVDTPPELQSATIEADGETLTLVFDENVTGDHSGIALAASGGVLVATYSSGSGTDTLVFSLSRTVASVETVLFDYEEVGGTIEDEAENQLEDISGFSVTNESEVVAPELDSAVIDAAGTTLTLTFDENVTGHDGFSLSVAGGATIEYDSGDGTDTLVFTISRTIYAGESVTLNYTPGDVEGTSLPLASFSDFAVTNNSEEESQGNTTWPDPQFPPANFPDSQWPLPGWPPVYRTQ